MKINQKACFCGMLCGMLAPAIVTADMSQNSRKISSLSSYKHLLNRVKSDENQMREDFYAAGDDIRRAMNSNE
ncbi:MAG: hypothetical protein J6583_11120 [Gilliamella sp.]|nr:hypothetical protein [Gilliamella sp.]MCO6555058.1 hypothetical protein [Gilliamella sp.]